jgi:hypothetical protein
MLGLKQTVACPYCYYDVDLAKVMMRCSGRPAPGKDRCEQVEDATRVKVLADGTATYPSFKPLSTGPLERYREVCCPRCGGPSNTRVCPVCHSALPASFSANSPIFGVVGVKASGKTVMLTMLARELTSTVARRFNASIDSVGASALMDKMHGWQRDMESGGTLPDPTAQYSPAETVPAVIEWRYTKSGPLGLDRARSTILSFYDTAGEDLKTMASARNQHYLEAADGLILILDPFGFPKNRDRALARGIPAATLDIAPIAILRSITEMLRASEHTKTNKKIKAPLAVVLGKIDAFFDQVGPDHPLRRPSGDEPFFDEKESLDLHNHVEALVAEWNGDDVLRTLQQNYSTYRFFAASALGAEPDYGAAKNRVNSRGLSPHRVTEPLLWLMATRGFVPKGN